MKIEKSIILVATNCKYTLIDKVVIESFTFRLCHLLQNSSIFSAFNFTEGMFPLTQHSQLNPSKTPTAETARLASQRGEVLTDSCISCRGVTEYYLQKAFLVIVRNTVHLVLVVNDTQSDSIQYLNFAKK